MVWDRIKICCRRKLVKVDGTVKSENYISLIRSNILLDYENGNLLNINVLLAKHDMQGKVPYR